MDILDKTIRNYIIRKSVNYTLMIIALSILITVVDWVRAHHHLQVQEIVSKLLGLPMRLEVLLPVLALGGMITAIQALGGVERFQALATLGYHPRRLCKNLLIGALLFIFAFVLVSEVICPAAIKFTQQYMLARTASLQGGSLDAIWLQRGQHLIHVRSSVKPRALEDYYAFGFDNNNLVSVIHSPYGEWREDHWALLNVTEWIIGTGDSPEKIMKRHAIAALPDSYLDLNGYFLPLEYRSYLSIGSELGSSGLTVVKIQGLSKVVAQRTLTLWVAVVVVALFARRVSVVTNQQVMRQLMRRGLIAALGAIMLLWCALNIQVVSSLGFILLCLCFAIGVVGVGLVLVRARSL